MLMDTPDHLGRGVAMSAGHLTVAMRAELGRLLAASRGDKRKALAAGLSELHTRKILHAKEATELAAIMEMFFAAPDGHDPKLAHRASTYFQALSVDFDSSPAALAIASVITSPRRLRRLALATRRRRRRAARATPPSEGSERLSEPASGGA
jgi:hypothetical protein